MKRIRIGNDLTICWEIFRKTEAGNEPYELDAGNCELRLVTPYRKEKVEGFIVDNNAILWTFRGKDQKQLGAYSLELVQRDGQEGMLTVDTCDVFEVVSHSCKVSSNEEGCTPSRPSHAEVRRIRIGKDFDIRWAIYKVDDGVTSPYNLEGKACTLRLITPYTRQNVEGFSVEGNVVVWTFRGKDQKHTGTYSLELVENAGKEGMMTVDTCKAFELVSHSCAETVESGDNLDINADALVGTVAIDTVEIDSSITSEGVEVKSEVAVAPYIPGVVDTELSLESDNPVANYVLTAEFERVDTQLKAIQTTQTTLLQAVKDNTDKITILTADETTEGSVDYKITNALRWGRIDSNL